MLKINSLTAICAVILAHQSVFASENTPPLGVGSFDAVTDPAPYQADSVELASDYFLKTKRYEKAIELLETRLKSEPENKQYRLALCDAHVAFGDALTKKKDIQGAVREYESALKADEQCHKAKDKIKALSN